MALTYQDQSMPNMKPANLGGGMGYPQQPQNQTIPGQMTNMVKALMDGNDQYKQAQDMKNMLAQRAAQTNGIMPTPVGPPMSITPPMAGQAAPMTGQAPVNPATMPGAAQQPVGQMPPFPVDGTAPFDPTAAALFSPIPGAGG